MSKAYRAYFIVKAMDDDNSAIKIVASTANTDRMGDVVEQSWLLDNFRANPVILWGHDASIPPVGRATSIEVEQREGGPALMVGVKFDEGDHNPLANTVAEQFRNGTLNAVSVGFRPGAVTPRSSLDPAHPMFAATGMILAQNELLEISAVTIPANAEALAVRAMDDESDTADLITAAVKEALGDMPALVLDAVRNDPEVRAAIVGHMMAQESADTVTLSEMLKATESGKVVSLDQFLKG